VNVAVDLGRGFEVRRAVPGDAESLALLEQEARHALLEARGGPQLLAESPVVDDWATLVAEPLERVWVAAVDAVVVGYLQLSLPDAAGIAHVRQVHVHPDARELGFGDELLARAIEATLDAGGSVIESWALPGDRDTKNLYERAGVTARKLIVSKRLR
jgi:GNAT superfamily N-acetyltransferase